MVSTNPGKNIQVSDLLSIYEKLPVGIVILSEKGEVVSANPYTKTVLGLCEEDLQGGKITDMLRCSVRQDGSGYSDEEFAPVITLRTGISQRNQVVGIRNGEEGEVRWIQMDSLSVNGSGNTGAERVLCLFTDVTAQFSLENRLRGSEEQYRMLVDEMSSGLLIIQDGIIKYTNRAVMKISGYESAELRGKEFLSFIHPDEQTRVFDQYQKRIKGEIINDQYRTVGIRKDGKPVWLDIKANPIQYDKGSAIMVLLNHVDAEVQWEQKLAESECRFRSLFEYAPVGMALSYESGQFIATNQRLSEILGYTPSELQEMSFSDFTHPEDFAQELDLYEEIITGKRESFTLRNRYFHRAGNLLCCELKTRIIKNDDGSHLIVRMLMDCTEQQAAREKLVEAMEKAEESSRLKSAFLATISHEVRTPLNAVLGFSEIILNTNDDASVQKYAKTINENGWNLLEIIDEMLELALTEHGRIRLHPVQVKPEELCSSFKGTLDALMQKTGGANVKTFYTLDPRLKDQTLVLDKGKVFQVILNLFKNALKFTEDGYIKLGCIEKDAGSVSFFVEDTGIGILPEQQELIFDFFRQGDDSQTKKYGGIGVGLAISRRLAQFMNGDLTVESKPGEGAVFTLTIPKRID